MLSGSMQFLGGVRGERQTEPEGTHGFLYARANHNKTPKKQAWCCHGEPQDKASQRDWTPMMTASVVLTRKGCNNTLSVRKVLKF